MQEIRNSKINVGITGASGLIGRHLTKALIDNEYTVIPLGRGFDAGSVKNCDIIINLAGANIGKRWTKKYKNEIWSSRINTTKKLSEILNDLFQHESSIGIKRDRMLISASATGIYKSDSDQIFTEKSYKYGGDFLAELCKAWEEEAMRSKGSARVAIVRFGLVMTKEGGTLPKMILPSKFGVKIIFGTGNQKISWISLEDLIRGIVFIIENRLEGPFNFTAPGSLTYSALADIISNRYKTFIKIKIPDLILGIILKDGSKVVTSGQVTYPERLIENGFKFNSPLFMV
jgi:hypothetical protein